MAPEDKDNTNPPSGEKDPPGTSNDGDGDGTGGGKGTGGQRGLTEEMKQFIEKEVNMDLEKHKQELLKLERTKLETSFRMDDWKAAVGEAGVKVADMDGTKWEAVFNNNSLLCAHKVKLEEIGNKYVPVAIERTVKPAFRLKTDATTKKSTIPYYRADDNSTVNVVETKSALQTSLARSSFTETDVEAAAGGGAFGISAAAKASLKISDSEQVAHNEFKEESKLIVSYNFPRASVSLDLRSLELSDNCKKRLEEIKTKKDPELIYDFEQEFGQYYATRVLLGGRLHSSSSMTSTQSQDASQRSNAMKAAASVAITAPYVSASASASHERQTSTGTGKDESKFDYSIAWEALGGDTLLCNNPPAWCVSVASYYNWRIVQQDEVVHLVDFIGRMKGYEEYPGLFNTILRGAQGRPPFKFQLKDAASSGELLTIEKFPPKEKDSDLLEYICRAYGNPRWNANEELFKFMRKQGLNHLLSGTRLSMTKSNALTDKLSVFTAKHIDGSDIETLHFNVMYKILDETEQQELYVTTSTDFFPYQYAKSRLCKQSSKTSYAVFRSSSKSGKISASDVFQMEFFDEKRKSLGICAQATSDYQGMYQVMPQPEANKSLAGKYLDFKLSPKSH